VKSNTVTSLAVTKKTTTTSKSRKKPLDESTVETTTIPSDSNDLTGSDLVETLNS
ncbi:unnamed protein product, partial [Didymodactylos carnosus]